MNEGCKHARVRQRPNRLSYSPWIGRRLPEVQLRRPTGSSTTLTPYLGNETTLLCFFHGVWCQEFVGQLRELKRYHQKLAAQGLGVVAVIRDRPEAVATFIEAESSTLPYALIADPDGSAHQCVGVGGQTLMLLVDSRRIIRRVLHRRDRSQASGRSHWLEELQATRGSRSHSKGTR